jgi:hypothetical protein
MPPAADGAPGARQAGSGAAAPIVAGASLAGNAGAFSHDLRKDRGWLFPLIKNIDARPQKGRAVFLTETLPRQEDRGPGARFFRIHALA